MQILVLNSTYQPINITSLSRGFKLVFKGKAEILEHIHDNPLITSLREYKRPTVIRLYNYAPVPYRKVHLSRVNVFKRDGYKCGYCFSTKNLTIDHIMPRSRGGKNTWENLVTCCGSCNLKKSDKTPEEIGMPLKISAFKPSFVYFIKKFEGHNDGWINYI